ncbi:hypothetical protein [Shigella flexneri]|uniref:hypothetical protein n=1 Tax=Shigella flexneri TaxID=623 RepID=UPI0034494E71
MSAAKALAYALCDKLESKKVDEVVRNLVSSGWNIREVAWEASSFDHEMPYFDTGRDFDIGFPDTLSSKIEFLTANGSIVQVKWHTEFGHLNRGDMLTSEQHRCSNEKKKF